MVTKGRVQGTFLLEELVARMHVTLEREKRPGRAAERVAEGLRPFLGSPDLLLPSQCEPDPDRYRQHVLYVPEDGSFSLVALVWMPGQSTPIHDHVCWCVVGVHQGSEQEVRYELRGKGAGDEEEPCLVPEGTSVNPSGSVSHLTPPGDIHRVVNPGPGIAVSIHVYGADVSERGTSIRRRYDHQVQESELAWLAERGLAGIAAGG